MARPRTKRNKNCTLRSFRYRIYPDDKQKRLFEDTFLGVRKVYNALLEKALEDGISDGKYGVRTQKYVKELPGLEWLGHLDSLALANAECNLKQAFQNHYENPKHFGLPRFKKRKRDYCPSYTTNCVNNNIRIENGKLRLPKAYLVNIRMHRPLASGYKLKSVTVSKVPSGKYYASIIMVSVDIQEAPVVPQKFFGMDFKMNGLFVGTEEINDFDYPDFIKGSLHRLVKAQRNLSRCKEGSKNEEKRRLRLARIHEEIADRRRDYLQKLSTKLADAYDLIAVEDLNIKSMSRKKRDARFFAFGRSIANNGWSMFLEMLRYKMKERGKYLIKVGKQFPSSKLCSVCGTKNISLRLQDRQWICGTCHTRHDRDKNAALNILMEGQRIYSANLQCTGGRREIKPVEKNVRRHLPSEYPHGYQTGEMTQIL